MEVKSIRGYSLLIYLPLLLILSLATVVGASVVISMKLSVATKPL